MKRVVADASVALKWFFRERDGENGIDQAAGLLNAAVFGRVVLTQPPHFAAEVAGVLARESPATAQRDLQRLLSVEPVHDNVARPGEAANGPALT